jgi:hypothetical protein
MVRHEFPNPPPGFHVIMAPDCTSPRGATPNWQSVRNIRKHATAELAHFRDRAILRSQPHGSRERLRTRAPWTMEGVSPTGMAWLNLCHRPRLQTRATPLHRWRDADRPSPAWWLRERAPHSSRKTLAFRGPSWPDHGLDAELRKRWRESLIAARPAQQRSVFRRRAYHLHRPSRLPDAVRFRWESCRQEAIFTDRST